MIASFKSYLLYGNLFCGIEHTAFLGEDTLYATVLKKSKKELDIVETFKGGSIESLVPKLPKKQHVFLVVNNDHVLTKRIKGESSDSEKRVFNAFPNINLDDFYYEVMTQGPNHFVSICRKGYLDELITKYKMNGITIINVSLGNMVASGVSRFVNSNTLLTSNASLSIENDTIAAIEKIETKESISYNINGLSANNNYVLSLAGALDSVLHHFQSVTNLDVLKQSLKNDYNQSRFFTLFLKMGLGSVLGVLLINFFVFNHYFNAVSTLQQTSQVNQTTKQTLLKLDESVSKSQKMVDDMLKSSASKSSFYVNTIVQSLPQSVLLTELNYQPLEKSIKRDKAIILKDNTIIVSGASNTSELFSKWITDLETINWIQNVEILSYEDASKSVSNFSIKINASHD